MNVLEESAVVLMLLLPRPWLNVKRGRCGDDESDEFVRAGRRYVAGSFGARRLPYWHEVVTVGDAAETES